MAVVTIRVQQSRPTQERWQQLAARRTELGLCPSCAEPVAHFLEHGDWDDSFTCKTVWSDPLVELVEAASALTAERKRRRSRRLFG